MCPKGDDKHNYLQVKYFSAQNSKNITKNIIHIKMDKQNVIALHCISEKKIVAKYRLKFII